MVDYYTHFYEDCYTLTFIAFIISPCSHLPAHGPLLQASVSVLGPEQSAPPPDGGGLVQVRERFFVPAPQVTLHAPNFPPVTPSAINNSCKKSV